MKTAFGNKADGNGDKIIFYWKCILYILPSRKRFRS